MDLNNDQQLDMIAWGEREVTMGPTPFKRRVFFSEQDVSAESLNVDDVLYHSPISGKLYSDALTNSDWSLDVTVVHMTQHWNDVRSAIFPGVSTNLIF